MAFCCNCGTKLVEGARFCHCCGSMIGNRQTASKQMSSVDTASYEPQRKQEYVGKILKCSNCGAVITETTVICPECGLQITGRDAILSVREFQQQLMSIELSRKKSKFVDG